MREPTVQLPGQWSTLAAQTDSTFYFIYWLSVLMFVGIIGAMLYFVVKYKRVPGVKAEPTGHNNLLEIGWTVAPAFLLVVLFHRGFQGYINSLVSPADSMEVRVRARKWAWDFEYPNGGHSNELHVPLNRPVRLIISSEDVLHAVFIPAFRVKRDAVPGAYGTLWFQATQLGRTELFCAEYCGAAETGTPGENPNGLLSNWAGHYSMMAQVIIENQPEYDRYVETLLRRPDRFHTDAEWGADLFVRNQCNTCHSLNGAASTGPTFQNLFGRVEHFQDGSSLTVDDNYIRESILTPMARVVRGYNPVMPSFRGTLREQQINALLQYIRTVH